MSGTNNTGSSLLTLEELDEARFRAILGGAANAATQSAVEPDQGKMVAFLADRRSVRTRVATQVAAHELGMGFVDIPWEMFYADPAVRTDHAQFSAEELRSLADLGVAALVARVSDHSILESWRDVRALPIVNGCSDREHPLQGLTDAFVIERRFGTMKDIRLTFVGNGASPVLASLLELTRLGGLRVTVVTPEGYAPAQERLERLGLRDAWRSDLASGLAGADVVYADEAFYRALTEKEIATFAPYRLTGEVADRLFPDAAVMHCLPHSDEVEARVLERDTSLVREQVRCRVPVTRAVLSEVRE